MSFDTETDAAGRSREELENLFVAVADYVIAYGPCEDWEDQDDRDADYPYCPADAGCLYCNMCFVLDRGKARGVTREEPKSPSLRYCHRCDHTVAELHDYDGAQICSFCRDKARRAGR